MEQLQLTKKQSIDLYNQSSITFWTRKLKITHEQLTDAVISTGSLHVTDIKRYMGIREFSLYDLLNWRKSKNQS